MYDINVIVTMPQFFANDCFMISKILKPQFVLVDVFQNPPTPGMSQVRKQTLCFAIKSKSMLLYEINRETMLRTDGGIEGHQPSCVSTVEGRGPHLLAQPL